MIETSAEIKNLIGRLGTVMSGLHGVKKDSVNPHFKNRYASLEAVIETVRGPLLENQIVFTQAPGRIIDGAVEITTMLMHESGEWMRSTLHVPLAKNDPQGVGSAITYGCRYALMATLGLPPVDDDAEAAVGRGPTPQPSSAPSRPTGSNVSQTPEQYVDMAIKQLGALKVKSALQTFWQNEKPNRERHKLSQDSGPGLKLYEAYLDTKALLESELKMAG